MAAEPLRTSEERTTAGASPRRPGVTPAVTLHPIYSTARATAEVHDRHAVLVQVPTSAQYSSALESHGRWVEDNSRAKKHRRAVANIAGPHRVLGL